MSPTLETRLAELEKQVAQLTAQVRQRPVAKDWRNTLGLLVDDELSRAVDQFGEELRAQTREP